MIVADWAKYLGVDRSTVSWYLNKKKDFKTLYDKHHKAA